MILHYYGKNFKRDQALKYNFNIYHISFYRWTTWRICFYLEKSVKQFLRGRDKKLIKNTR